MKEAGAGAIGKELASNEPEELSAVDVTTLDSCASDMVWKVVPSAEATARYFPPDMEIGCKAAKT